MYIFNLWECVDRRILAFPWTDTVSDAELITDSLTLRLFFFTEGCVNCCHHNVRNILGAFFGETQHGLERLITETAADQFVVTVCIRSI